MSSISSRQEFTSPVAADRLFKALIIDSDNLIPKLMAQVIKSIEIIHGDGGVGSIKQINFAEYTLDVENLVCKYTLIEGDVLDDKIKSISYEVSFHEYDAAGDLEINEEEIRGGKEGAMGMYKVVEAYLFESPGAYE
ncbi:unnamed protein product [Malus baccata var. baccata]